MLPNILLLGIHLVKHSTIVNSAVVPHFFTPLLLSLRLLFYSILITDNWSGRQIIHFGTGKYCSIIHPSALCSIFT